MNDDTVSRRRCGADNAFGNSGKKAGRGFTIVETLIVMAVTGMLLISAIVLVSGQQRKVEFSQAAEDIRSSIENTISQVSSGYYPNPGGIKCVASGGNLNISANTGTGQGSNTGCIFLGRAIQFGVKDSDPQEYVVHTIAGLQDNAGTVATAKPQAIDIASARDTQILRNGLRAISMKYVVGGVRTDIGAVAFVNGLGDHDASDQLISGSQQMSLVPIRGSGTVPNTTIGGVVGAVNSQMGASPTNPDGGVLICFSTGESNKSALVTIGSNGRNLTVKLDYKNTGDCS